jgi:hypothetical protein
MRNLWLIVVLLFIGACASAPTSEVATQTVVPTRTQITTLPTDILSPAKTPTVAAISTNTPAATLTVRPTRSPPTEIATATAAPISTDVPRPTSIATSTPAFVRPPSTMPGSILIAYGVGGKPSLAHVDVEGNVHPLGELGSRFDSWYPLQLSPDGKWLAYLESSGLEDELILHKFHERETQTVSLPMWSTVEGPVFDATGERVAYTISADPAHQINGLHAWAIFVRDLATESETLFGGPFLAHSHERPLPGDPIAWIDDELLLSTFVYHGEQRNRGVWVLDVGEAIPGETVSLQAYDRQVLSPEDVSPRLYWRPTISPGSDMLAFLIYDYDYKPSCLDDNRYEESSMVALGVVSLTGGEPRILVDATRDDGALATPLTWSPDGQQVLFAQGQCQDQSTLFESTLRAVDLQGSITGEWPLARVETIWWGEALWCTPDDVFYTHNRGELWHLNLVTGQSKQVLSSKWVRLVGCLP